MYYLGLEKVEEAEIKLTTFAGSQKKAREFQKNICFTDYTNISDCVDHNKLWTILKEMGIPDHVTCLRNLYVDQEATVRQGTTDWFKIGKGVGQGCILLPCSFNFYAECAMRNAGLDESGNKLGTRLPRQMPTTSDMQMIPLSWQKVGGTREPLNEGKRGE